ncbi:MmgE/PrpD family protein [Noviherbaspirillum sp.]|jgi:2-methylcitrate dehydratase PrpD|uniref:MmgE/PrpD family protein n=1 Tax=Noviherbaspirillum sp. TaxID=1926288 RepID=UPI0025E49E75|nr:MmgE/PrpD family protein [Noviherbaspirillum sp.]
MSTANAAENGLNLPPDFSLKLCENIATWRYEDLPESVVRMLKFFLIDTLGVIGGASKAPGIAELNQRLSRWESSGSATGLVGGRRYSPPTAAMANGAAAHALDFDDMHDFGRVHTNCVVLPTLLATAQDIGAVSGKDFLLALAIGTELHARLGLACYDSLGKGWHPTMVLGTLAASLAAGRLLKLDAEGLRNALGMAYHQASGSAQSMRDGVISKRLGPGFAARAAVVGAFLAADGLTGTRESLEGSAGLFALYERNQVKPELLMDGLGKTWRIDEYSFKPYPGCRCNHTSIGIAIGLHNEGIVAEDIETVEIRMGEVNWLTVGIPYEVSRDSVVHAQFNVSYSFARALIDGEVGLHSYQRPAISDPRVVALAEKVRVVVDTTIGKTEIAPATIKLTFKDGRTMTVQKTTIKGSQQEPMTDQELLTKFRGCLSYGMNAAPDDANRLAQTILNLENQVDAVGVMMWAFPKAPAGC